MANTVGGLRGVKPGDMVLSLSEVIKQLESKLSRAELEDLLQAIISMRKQEVKPGDLITADLMNQVLAELADLQVRVARLETGAIGDLKPVILSVTPKSLRIGEILTVNGFNFPEEPREGDVDIAGVPVLRFAAASEKQLVFTVPRGLQSAILPADLSLTVRNGKLSDSATVRVLPEISAVTGNVVVTNETASLPEIKIGNSYAIDFLVDSRTNIAESYKIKAVYSEAIGAATAADWLKDTSLTDKTTGQPLPAEVRIEPGSPKAVRVDLKVPTGAASVKLELSAASVSKPSDPKLNQVSNPPYLLTVGAVVTPSDPRTTFRIMDYGPLANARLATIDGKPGVEIAFGKSEFVTVEAAFTVKGSYRYSRELKPDLTGWTVSDPVPAASQEQAGSKEEIAVDVTSAGTTSQKRTLIIKANRQADADGAAFESWVEIPIRGF